MTGDFSFPSLTQALSAYLPADRLRAMVAGRKLAVQARGAALFADISGFTMLTEALTQSLGPRRGAEELTRQLNWVYDALVTELHQRLGSVISFSGDAITCWFDDAEPAYQITGAGAAWRAADCALAMQRAMQAFSHLALENGQVFSLGMKASVASGPAMRLRVGDPDIQVMDALAGETLLRMAAGEHLAERDEVLLDENTVTALPAAAIREWRSDPHSGLQFGVLEQLSRPPPPRPEPGQSRFPSRAELRPWMLAPVYERLVEGVGEFLTELRPAVVIFLYFGGLDFDHDPQAGKKLDSYIRYVQGVVHRYGGNVMQLTIGDKGSYLYAVFGAPLAHEDDVQRALHTAWKLHTVPPGMRWIEAPHLGVNRGMTRCGAYGGSQRRTYGVLGDGVNLAARLMQHARPGEVLVSQELYLAAHNTFDWEVLEPIQVKGKRDPVAVARLSRPRQRSSANLLQLPDLVGRVSELAALRAASTPLETGQPAGIVYLFGEAGIGKSRLIDELRRTLTTAEPAVQWFTCPAEQILQQSLYPFRHLLREYFEQTLGADENGNWVRFDTRLKGLLVELEAQANGLAAELSAELERTRSFLAALVDLVEPDSLYQQVEPKQRFENTRSALKALIWAESLRCPLVLHVEDGHWLDADSRSILQTLPPAQAALPLLVLINSRYADDGSRWSLELPEAVTQTVFDLAALPPDSIQALATQLLGSPALADLLDLLQRRTEGNPFFIEQLLLDLRERGLLEQRSEPSAGFGVQAQSDLLAQIPTNINAVLISRLDRLAGRVKAVVQTAAVLGNEFEIQILSQMLQQHPDLEQDIQQAGSAMIWAPLNEILFLFRHTLLRDAAYEMQIEERLRSLHQLAGEAIERLHADDLDSYSADLANHFQRAGVAAKTFTYSVQAGERAEARYANHEAKAHYERALDNAARMEDRLTTQTQAARMTVEIALGRLLINSGEYENASERLLNALSLSETLQAAESQAAACRWLAQIYERKGEYPPALKWMERGLKALGEIQSQEGAQLRLIGGLIALRQGNFPQALEQAERAGVIAAQVGDLRAQARANNLQGVAALQRGDPASALGRFETGLALYRQARDLSGQAVTHNTLANALFGLGRWSESDDHFRQARSLNDRVGDFYNRAIVDNNLGENALNMGRLDEALEYYQSALRTLEQHVGSAYLLGAVHNSLSSVHIRRGETDAARRHLADSQVYFEKAQARDFLPELQRHLAEAALQSGDLDAAEEACRLAGELAVELDNPDEQAAVLIVSGQIAARRGDFARAENLSMEGLKQTEELGDEFKTARAWLALAAIRLASGQKESGQEALAICTPVLERFGAALDLAEARDLQNRVFD